MGKWKKAIITIVGTAAAILYGALGCGDTIINNPEPTKDEKKDTVYVCDGVQQTTPCVVDTSKTDTSYVCNGVVQSTPCVIDTPIVKDTSKVVDTTRTYLCGEDRIPQNTPCENDGKMQTCGIGRTGPNCDLYSCLDGAKEGNGDWQRGPCPTDLDRFCGEGQEWYNNYCAYICNTPEYEAYNYRSHEPCAVAPKSFEDVVADAVEKCGVAKADEIYTPAMAEHAEIDPAGIAGVVRLLHSNCIAMELVNHEELEPFSTVLEYTQNAKGKLTKVDVKSVNTNSVCNYRLNYSMNTSNRALAYRDGYKVDGYFAPEGEDTVTSDGNRVSKIGFHLSINNGEEVTTEHCTF